MSVNSVLKAIADAIRAKTNTTAQMTLAEMPALIYSISGGSEEEPGNPNGYFVTTLTDAITMNVGDTQEYQCDNPGDTSGLDNSWILETGVLTVTAINNDGIVQWVEEDGYIQIEALKAGTAVIEISYKPEIFRGEEEHPKGTYGSIVTLTINVIDNSGGGEEEIMEYYYDTAVRLAVDETSNEYTVGAPYNDGSVTWRNMQLTSDAVSVVTDGSKWVSFTGISAGTATCTFTYTSLNPATGNEHPCTHVFNITVTDGSGSDSAPNYGVWTFRNDNDSDELLAYINENANGDSLNYLGFDIRFDVPGGVDCYIHADEGDQLLYEFERMEFHNNEEEGDSIIYIPVHEGANGGYPGSGTDYYYSRTIVLREEPSAELLAFLQKFFVQEYNSIFTIKLDNYSEFMEGIAIFQATAGYTWSELVAEGDDQAIYIDEGLADNEYPDGFIMVDLYDGSYHILQAQPSDEVIDGAVYDGCLYS